MTLSRLHASPSRRARASAALATVLLAGAAATAVVPAAAASPDHGTLSYAQPSVSWTGSGMTGSAAEERKITCADEATACDFFTLHIDTTLGGLRDPYATIDIVLTPDATAMQDLVLYPPGCDHPAPATTCYSVPGGEAIIGDPQNGDWTIGVSCTACASAGYSATATLQHIVPDLPAMGDTSARFDVQHLPDPTPDSNQLTTQYGEPAIWMNKHGYGIVNTFGPTVWITKDGGKTWSPAYDILDNDNVCPSGYAGDADAVVGIDDTFYADNLCLGTVGGVNNEVFVNSAHGDPGDKGANWQGPFLAGGDSDRQWLAPDPVDPNIIYFSFHDLSATQNVEMYKSTDKGQTWVCPQTGAPAEAAPCPITATAGGGPAQSYPDSLSGNVTTRGMVDPTDHNSIYVPYANSAAANGYSAPPNRGDTELGRFRMAVSHDGGKTWSANTDSTGDGSVIDVNDGSYFPQSTASGDDNVLAHIFIAAAMDTKGGLYALFSLRLGGHTETHLYLMTSTDHGLTWSTPHQVDSGDLNSNVFPAIAVGDPGRVAMAWYGSKSHDFNDTKAMWSMMYSVTTDALDAHPTFDQTRMSGDFPVHGADVCQAGTFCAVTNGNRDLADYQTGAVDQCGFAQFVYTDDYSGAGSTHVARQVAGTNLYATPPCPQTAGNVQTLGSHSGTLGNAASAPAASVPNTSAAPSGERGGAVLAIGLLGLCGVIGRRTRRRSDGTRPADGSSGRAG